MHAARKKPLVLGILAVAAALFLLATYGTALPMAPFMPVEIDEPITADTNGSFTAIADTDSRRVLILNSDNNLTGVIDCTTLDTPIDAVTDVCVSGEHIYLTGLKYRPDSSGIELERVVRYDKGGNQRGVVYTVDGNNYAAPAIKGLNPADGGVVVTVEDHANDEESGEAMTRLHFVLLAGGETTEITSTDVPIGITRDAAFSMKSQELAALSFRGMLELEDYSASRGPSDDIYINVDLDDDGLVYTCNSAGDLSVMGENGDPKLLVDGEGIVDIHANNGFMTLSSLSSDSVTICRTDGTVIANLTSVTPSLGYSLRISLVWACGLYLAALTLTLLARNLMRSLRSGQIAGIGALLTSLAVVTAVGVAIANLSYASYLTSRQTRVNEVNLSADYLSSSLIKQADALESICNRNLLAKGGQDLENAVAQAYMATADIDDLVFAAQTNGIGLYYTLYAKDDRGIYYLADDTSQIVLGTDVPTPLSEGVLGDAFSLGFDRGSELFEGRTLRDSTQYRLVPVRSSDQSRVIAVVEVGCKLRSFDAAIAAGLSKRLLELFVLMLVVYLSYVEIRSCGQCLISFRQLQQKHAHDALAVLTRPFTFCITILSSIDGVMTVLIARSMLVAAGQGNSSPLLALPAVMLGVGLMAGQVLYGFLGPRVPLRHLIAGGALVMMLLALGAVAVVLSGNFWLYCAAKLALSIPFGLLYTLGYSMPRLAHSDETRTLAAGGVKRTDTSAAALGTVLGGYAAQTLGNAWVYVIVAIACLPVLFMALSLLPKGAEPAESSSRIVNVPREVVRLVRGRLALFVTFLVLLPNTVAGGYTSFLFPLFSADLGLAKADINNIYVIGQLIVFVCISSIEVAEQRHGKWTMTSLALALIGCVLLLFSLNTTFVWSIAVVAIIGVLSKTVDGWKAMWLHSADKAGVPSGAATGMMFASRSLVMVAQPFIMGALLGLTNSTAVIIIGAICTLSALAFVFATRHSSLADL